MKFRVLFLHLTRNSFLLCIPKCIVQIRIKLHIQILLHLHIHMYLYAFGVAVACRLVSCAT